MVGAEGCAFKPLGARFRLHRPGLHGVHQKGVDAAEAESPEHATGERAAAFPGDQHVGASCAFGKREIAVFFDDELAAEGNHEEDAEPSAEQREREDAPEVNSEPKPRKISAGMVNITPAASDSPAEPVVCTMLFSRMVERPKARKMLIDRTEIGIEAETVSPARTRRRRLPRRRGARRARRGLPRAA